MSNHNIDSTVEITNASIKSGPDMTIDSCKAKIEEKGPIFGGYSVFKEI